MSVATMNTRNFPPIPIMFSFKFRINFRDKPNLVFYDLIQCVKSLPSLVVAGCATTQQCVKNCPSTTWTWVTLYSEEKVYGINIEKRKEMLCLDHIDFTQAPWSTYDLKDLIFDGYCAPYLIEEKPIIYRCMPSFLVDTAYAMTNKTLYDSMNNTISEVSMRASKEVHKAVLEVQNWGQKALADVQACWVHMLVFGGIALVFAFLWIVLLRFFAKAIIWTTIIVFIILWLAGTAFCFWRYNLLTNYVDITPPEEMRVFTDAISFQTEFDNPDLWLAVGIICGVILLVTLIVLCFLGARIRLAIALFEETSRALAHMPSVLFWPLFPFAIQLATVAWAVAAAVCLATLGRAQFVSSSNSSDYSGILPLPDSLTSCNYGDALTSAVRATESAASGAASAVGQSYPTNSSNAATNEAISYVNASLAEACRFLKYGGAEYAVFFQIFNVFMFFWNFNFIAGFGITTLASAFASYYWAFDKSSDIPKFPLLTGLWRTFRYHLGSIAFGSLLIAIVQLIRVLLDYLFMKMKKQRNHVAAFLVKCLECCFSCIEKLVKFIARKAYIMVAVHGKNFCASALEAWQLITRNALRAVVLTGVSRFLIIVSKLIVTGSIIVLAYFYFHGELPAAWSTLGPTWPVLNYFYVPVVVIFFSFCISHDF